MPRKQRDLCLAKEENSTITSKEYVTRDVDNLVQELKDNLRLKGSKPSKHLGSMKSKLKLRAAPYTIPTLAETKCSCCNSLRCVKKSCKPDDPYEIFEDLLKDGDLIKEAVKRLKIGLVPHKKSDYYDSDDELRTPPYPFNDFEV